MVSLILPLLFGVLPECQGLQVSEPTRNTYVLQKGNTFFCAPESHLDFYTHHKTGTVMSREARGFITDGLSLQCDGGLHADVQALDEGSLPPSSTDNTRFLHFERDPFETVVSAYLYHQGCPEPWMNVPIGNEQNMRGWSGWGNTRRWKHQAQDGIAQLLQAAEAGELPAVESSDTFSSYLVRVDDESGLHAEALVALQMIFPNMADLHEAALSAPFAANICLSEFYDDCIGTWTKGFKEIGAEIDIAKGIADSASSSCPGADPTADKHSSKSVAKSAGVDIAPLADLMEKLNAIDKASLDGKLKTLKNQIACPVNDEYMLAALKVSYYGTSFSTTSVDVQEKMCNAIDS